MPPVDEWASDTDYSPPASVGVSQATKVEPSAGAKAQGFLPGVKVTAQRLNWILNALCVLANDNEANIEALDDLLALRSLQAAYARSVALAETAPHIDVAGSTLVIGGTDSGVIFRLRGTGSPGQKLLEANSGLYVEGGIDVGDGTIELNGGAFTVDINGNVLGVDITASADLQVDNDANVDGNLDVGGDATVTGLLTAPLGSVRFSAGGGRLNSGTWTPSVASVSGTGAVSGDVSTTSGHWQRVGNIAFFTLRFGLDTTGWSGTIVIEFDLPVGASITGGARGVAVPEQNDATRFLNTSMSDASGLKVSLTVGASLGVSRFIQCSGSYVIGSD